MENEVAEGVAFDSHDSTHEIPCLSPLIYLHIFFFFLGMCEALWQPDMNTEEIFECIAQALTNALDRDASSGWGAVVHIIEAERITTKKIKTRMD